MSNAHATFTVGLHNPRESCEGRLSPPPLVTPAKLLVQCRSQLSAWPHMSCGGGGRRQTILQGSSQ